MKVLTPGHKYELAHFEKSIGAEHIQFIEKKQLQDGTLLTLNDGTTNEEVLAMLIDRLEFLNNRMPCIHNSLSISLIRTARDILNQRTADRKARGVEGTHKA